MCAKLCLTLCDPMDCLSDFQGKKTGAGCHFLLQGIFLTQRPNPNLLCLLHWQAGSLTLEPCGKPLYQCYLFILNVLLGYT